MHRGLVFVATLDGRYRRWGVGERHHEARATLGWCLVLQPAAVELHELFADVDPSSRPELCVLAWPWSSGRWTVTPGGAISGALDPG
jgi:hypothetical protein